MLLLPWEIRGRLLSGEMSLTEARREMGRTFQYCRRVEQDGNPEPMGDAFWQRAVFQIAANVGLALGEDDVSEGS